MIPCFGGGVPPAGAKKALLRPRTWMVLPGILASSESPPPGEEPGRDQPADESAHIRHHLVGGPRPPASGGSSSRRAGRSAGHVRKTAPRPLPDDTEHLPRREVAVLPGERRRHDLGHPRTLPEEADDVVGSSSILTIWSGSTSLPGRRPRSSPGQAWCRPPGGRYSSRVRTNPAVPGSLPVDGDI